MKKSILISATVFAYCILQAAYCFPQGTAINTTGAKADSSAMLDVSSTNKGILIPRVSLILTTSASPVSSPATGLMVWNTSTINDVTPGYYYWNGSEWAVISGGGGSGCSSAPASPVSNPGTAITPDRFTASWNSVSGATSYCIDVSTDAGFSTFVSGYNNLNVGNVIQFIVYGLTYNTTYYYRVRATNDCGTSASSNEISVTSIIYYIGDRGPSGGKVFYDKGAFSSGWRFMEAATSDQSTGAQWGCNGVDIPGAAGVNIGTGAQNTTDIDNACSTPNIAADLCVSLVFNGFNDWFLPAQWEILEVYNQKAIIDNLALADYWTSSEVNSTSAFRMSSSGSFTNRTKTDSYRVRCIRSF